MFYELTEVLYVKLKCMEPISHVTFLMMKLRCIYVRIYVYIYIYIYIHTHYVDIIFTHIHLHTGWHASHTPWIHCVHLRNILLQLASPLIAIVIEEQSFQLR